MNIIWGTLLTLISLVGYVGQLVTAFWPDKAVALNLTEPETAVDPTFHADVRGEAYWDTAVLWVLPAAGILLLFNNPLWPYFGLVGGGSYLYFAGRGIMVRLVMERQGIPIGLPGNLKAAYLFLALWGVTAAITIGLAIAALPLSPGT